MTVPLSKRLFLQCYIVLFINRDMTLELSWGLFMNHIWLRMIKGLVIFNPAVRGWSRGEGVKNFGRPARGAKNCKFLLRGLKDSFIA